MPIFISFLTKNVLFIKRRAEMEKGEIWGRHSLDIPKNRENQGRIHRISTIRKNVSNPSHFTVVPMKFAG